MQRLPPVVSGGIVAATPAPWFFALSVMMAAAATLAKADH
jgi:hypothetical protein